MLKYTTTTKGTTIDTSSYDDQRTTAAQYGENCPYMLPCGHCTKLGYMCPYNRSYKVTWSSVEPTC